MNKNEIIVPIVYGETEYHLSSESISYIIIRKELSSVCELNLNLLTDSVKVSCSDLANSQDKYTPKIESTTGSLWLVFPYESISFYERVIGSYIVIFLKDGTIFRVSDSEEFIDAMSNWWENN